MESIVFKAFRAIFEYVIALAITGTFVLALVDIQKKAFHSKSVGLTSMLKINQQLVGRTK